MQFTKEAAIVHVFSTLDRISNSEETITFDVNNGAHLECHIVKQGIIQERICISIEDGKEMLELYMINPDSEYGRSCVFDGEVDSVSYEDLKERLLNII